MRPLVASTLAVLLLGRSWPAAAASPVARGSSPVARAATPRAVAVALPMTARLAPLAAPGDGRRPGLSSHLTPAPALLDAPSVRMPDAFAAPAADRITRRESAVLTSLPAAAQARSLDASLAFTASGAHADRRPDSALDVGAHALARGFEFGLGEQEPVVASDGAAPRRLAAASDAPSAARKTPDSPRRRSAERRLPLLLWGLLANLVVTQIGLEALSLAVPVFGGESFGVGTLAVISAASSLALAAGGFLGSQAVDRFGPERVYIGTLALRAAAIGAMAALYSAGGLGATALVAFFATDYFLHYVNYVAIDTLAPRRLGGDAVALNRFGLWRGVVVDGVGFFGPLGAGAVIAAMGYGAIFWAYPVLFGLASLAGLALLRGRAGGGATTAPPARASSWRDALRELRGDPALVWSIAAFTVFSMTSMAFYFIVAPSFGAFAAAGGSAAPVASLLTGLLAGSGVLGAWILSRMTAAVERGSGGDADAARRALTRRMGWATAATGALMAVFWSFLDSAPLFTVLDFPVFLAHVLIVPFGAVMAVPYIGVMTVLQSRASEGAKAKIAGLNRGFAMTASFLFSYALGLLLPFLTGGGAPSAATFTVLAVAFTMLGAVAVFAGWRLARSASEPAAKTS